MILPEDVPQAQFMAYGFNVLNALLRRESIVDLSVRMMDKIQRARQSHSATIAEHGLGETNNEHSKDVIFVAHSLGGLLVRAGLMHPKFDRLRHRTKGIIFLGTPNFQKEDQWPSFIKTLFKTCGISKEQFRSLLPAAWTELNKINQDFIPWLRARNEPRRDICCFYETLPSAGRDLVRLTMILEKYSTNTVVQILPQLSTTLLGYPFLPLRATHCDLGKLDADNSYGYYSFLQQLAILMGDPPLVKDSLFTWYKVLELPEPQEVLRLASDRRHIILEQTEERTMKAKGSCILALALKDQAQYTEAEHAFRQAANDYELELGSKNSYSLFCMEECASMKREQCDYVQAEKLGKEIFKVRKQRKDDDLLICASNLARTLRYRGKYLKAYHVIKDTLMDVAECPFQEFDSTIAVSILGAVVRDLGRYTLAEQLLRDVVRSCHVHLGSQHAYTLARMSDLALVFSRQERFHRAEDLGRRALDGLEKSLGTRHPIALRSRKRLAMYLLYQRRTSEARSILEKTLALQTQALVPQHPDIASTTRALAAIYATDRRFREARVMIKTIIATREDHVRNGNDKSPEPPDLRWCRTAQSLLEDLLVMEAKKDAELNNPDAIIYDHFRKPTHPVHRDEADPDNLASWPLARSKKELETFDACQNSPETCDEKIRERGLRIACAMGEKKVVQSLLDFRVNINATGGYYGDALQVAAYMGNPELAGLLLDRKASINNPSGLFGFALRAAAAGGHIEVVKLLLDRKADPNAVDPMLGSSIEAAMSAGNDEVVKLLLISGANPNIRDFSMGTPLQQAAWAGKDDLVRLLLDKNADPSVRSKGGLPSAIELAALEPGISFTRVIDHLLEFDDPSMGDRYSKALETAAAAGHLEHVKVMLKYGASAPIEAFCDALQAAMVEGHKEVVKILASHKLMGHDGTVLDVFAKIRSIEPSTRVGDPIPFIEGGE